jgi:hypothetical protein
VGLGQGLLAAVVTAASILGTDKVNDVAVRIQIDRGEWNIGGG